MDVARERDRASDTAVEAAPKAPPAPAFGPAAVLALQRSAGNRAVAAMLARRHQPIDRNGRTMLFNWGVSWTPDGGGKIVDRRDGDLAPRLSVPVEAGTAGMLRLRVVAEVTMLAGRPGKWHVATVCSWKVRVAKDGTLKIGTAQPEVYGDVASPLQQGGPPGLQVDADMREFALTQTYVGGTESTTVSVPVVGGLEHAENDPAAPYARTFTAELDVTGVEDGSRSPIGPVYTPDEYQVHFGHNSAGVTGGEVAKLQAWWFKIPPNLRDRVKAGTVKVDLEGRASPPGTPAYNEGLAERRVTAVAATLRALGVASPQTSWPGSIHPVTGAPPAAPDPERDPEKRVVRVKVLGELAP